MHACIREQQSVSLTGVCVGDLFLLSYVDCIDILGLPPFNNKLTRGSHDDTPTHTVRKPKHLPPGTFKSLPPPWLHTFMLCLWQPLFSGAEGGCRWWSDSRFVTSRHAPRTVARTQCSAALLLCFPLPASQIHSACWESSISKTLILRFPTHVYRGTSLQLK